MTNSARDCRGIADPRLCFSWYVLSIIPYIPLTLMILPCVLIFPARSRVSGAGYGRDDAVEAGIDQPHVLSSLFTTLRTGDVNNVQYVELAALLAQRRQTPRQSRLPA